MRTPVEPIREHVKRLVAKGMSHPQIARAAGLNRATVRAVHTGEWETVNTDSADRLMAVEYTPPPRNATPVIPVIRVTEDDRCACHGTPIDDTTQVGFCDVECAFTHADCGHVGCGGLS